jgi:RND family efflux transporter MFP subunit
MNTKNRFILTIVTLSILVGLVGWLAGAYEKKIPPGKLDAPVDIILAERYVVKTIIENTYETATGTINARDETTVSSRILATINSIFVRAGNTVKKGDELVRLDDRELQAKFEQARQLVTAARVSLEETLLEYDRIKSLFERQVISRAEFDRVNALLKSRQANYQRSKEQLIEVKTALSFATIKSPIDGNVIERYAEPGDTASPGIPLIKIYNPSLLRLDAQVRESLASGINIGDNISTYIDAIQKELITIVDEIVPSADPGSRSITVKVLLPANKNLYPGMFGRLLIPTGTVKRLYVPINAISRLGQLEFLQVVKNEKISKRFIRTGRQNEKGEIEVLSGLNEGETILIN